VREIVKGKRVLVGVDANAVSPLWFSKGSGGSRDSELRGGVLEEWIIANSMIALNEFKRSYTFSGESDIDVTLVRLAWIATMNGKLNLIGVLMTTI